MQRRGRWISFLPSVCNSDQLQLSETKYMKSHPGQSHIATKDWSVDFFCKRGAIPSTANASPHIIMPVSGLYQPDAWVLGGQSNYLIVLISWLSYHMYAPPRRSHVGMPQKLWGYGSKSHRHVLKYPKIQVRRLILTEMLTVAKKKKLSFGSLLSMQTIKNFCMP